MEKWFVSPPDTIWAIALSTLGIYIVLIVFTRIAGKRSFSKMSSFDFAITVALGSVIASTILSASVSLLQGVAGLASLYIIQLTAAYLRRLSWFRNMIDNAPLMLMDGTNILEENLKKARVTESDLRSKLREANVIQVKEVKAVIFEATGDISVLHTSDNIDVEDWLLRGVER